MADQKLSALSVATLTDVAEMYLNASGSKKSTVESLRNFFLGAAAREVVVAASTANGALATAFEDGDTLDDVTLATGDRFLLKDQTAGEENGIYTVEASGTPTRATDFDTDGEAILGAIVAVALGTANAETLWMHTTTGSITLDTTSLTFAQVSGGGGGAVGKQTLWFPASSLQPTVSDGCASLTSIQTTIDQPDQHVLGFDSVADEHAQFDIAFPISWNKGTVTFKVFWTHQGGQTGGLDGVAWSLQGVSLSSGDPFATAYGTAVVVTDDQVTADDVYVTAESTAITIAGTPVDGDLTFFRLLRDVSDAADDLDIDAQFVGLQLFYTTNAVTDD